MVKNCTIQFCKNRFFVWVKLATLEWSYVLSFGNDDLPLEPGSTSGGNVVSPPSPPPLRDPIARLFLFSASVEIVMNCCQKIWLHLNPRFLAIRGDRPPPSRDGGRGKKDFPIGGGCDMCQSEQLGAEFESRKLTVNSYRKRSDA